MPRSAAPADPVPSLNSFIDNVSTGRLECAGSFNFLRVMVMARRPSTALTDGEARLMAVLWERGPATVGDVQDAVRSKHSVSYSTVQTMLRILETKGYVRHEKHGRAFVYRPVVDEKQARRKALRHLVSRLFDNSPSLLVLNVLEDDGIDPDELKRLKRMIKDA